jgi:CheY-like chemotaxis protein
MTADRCVLIASDALVDANLVKELLDDDFPNIAISTYPDLAIKDFIDHKPSLLVLAFKSITQAQDYYLGLYRNSPLLQSCPHRTVLLCTKDEILRAYELCKSGRFDDYVHFWPMSFDAPRLHMAIRGALRDLDRTITETRRSDELLAHAGQISQLDSRLGQHIASGSQRMDVVDNSLKTAEGTILTALNAFAENFSAHSSSEPAQPRDRTDIQREIERIKAENVEASLASVSGAMQSVRQWSDTIKDDLAPQIAAASALQEMAEESRPYILVVEDDVFQHRVLRIALKDLGAAIGISVSGADALASLQVRRPDLILMDFNLPDMEGADLIRQIKAVEQYSNIPVIMVSGRQERNVILECKAVGAVDFVLKPFERDTLLSKVRRWITDTDAASTPEAGQRPRKD